VAYTIVTVPASVSAYAAVNASSCRSSPYLSCASIELPTRTEADLTLELLSHYNGCSLLVIRAWSVVLVFVRRVKSLSYTFFIYFTKRLLTGQL